MSLGKRLFVGGAAEAFCMNTSDNPLQEATSSLVAGYSLDYDASDVTGDYDGTPSNVTFGVDGHINWGAEFNGTSSKISIGNPIGVSDSFTISAWFNASSGGFIYGRGVVASSGEHGVGIVYNSTNGNFYLTRNVGTSTLYYVQSANNIVPAGQWNFIAATFDRSGGGSNGVATIYANGSQVGQQTNWNTNNISYNGGFDSGVQVLGERGAGGFSSSYITGTLDQVRVFNRALDSDEVDTLYNESACTHIATTDTVGFPSTASSNLVAYYKLDGSAEDESSNSYDGTESNITYDFGRYGTAAIFNGSSSRVATSYNFGTDSSYSISIWMNTTVTSTRHFLYGVWPQNGANNGPGIGLGINASNNFEFTIGNGSSNYNNTSISASSYTDGGWHNLVLVVNGTNIKLYADGNTTPIANLTSTVSAGTSQSENLVLGRLGDYPGTSTGSGLFYYNGKLDQVRIYDKVLSSDEVGELYNEKQAYITKDGKNPFADDDEIAFYKFENNADDEHDSYDGTASNVTFTSGSGLFGTYAASFNGSSSYIDLGSAASLVSTDFTFSAWIKTTSTVISKFVVSTPVNPYYSKVAIRSASAGKLECLYGNATSNENSFTSTFNTINDGDWHHIVYFINQTEAKLYIDGSLDTTHTLTVTPSNIGTLNIGSLYSNSASSRSSYWDGSIDQVRIFDRELDGDEVFKLYAEVIN